MNNEREMLEFAAKTLGFHYVDGESWDDNAGWNSLHNSADCAAMCAKLKIDTTWEDVSVICSVPMFLNATWFEDHNNDREAAWRYAACKVAEAIGRAMK